MLTFTLAVLLSAQAQQPGVAVVPLDDLSAKNVAARAVFDAVEGALPSHASARGLSAKRFALVQPIDEAARRCRRSDVACIREQTRRLGARYAIVTEMDAKDGSVVVRLVDHASDTRAVAVTIRGNPPHVLAQAPLVVEALLEQVAPRAAHERNVALARLVKARAANDHEEAARLCFALAAMLPSEMATWTFDGADSLEDAGRTAEARAIFAQLASDDSIDDDVRLSALIRSRPGEDEPGPQTPQ